jgi:hypothetical protein
MNRIRTSIRNMNDVRGLSALIIYPARIYKKIEFLKGIKDLRRERRYTYWVVGPPDYKYNSSRRVK